MLDLQSVLEDEFGLKDELQQNSLLTANRISNDAQLPESELTTTIDEAAGSFISIIGSIQDWAISITMMT